MEKSTAPEEFAPGIPCRDGLVALRHVPTVLGKAGQELWQFLGRSKVEVQRVRWDGMSLSALKIGDLIFLRDKLQREQIELERRALASSLTPDGSRPGEPGAPESPALPTVIGDEVATDAAGEERAEVEPVESEAGQVRRGKAILAEIFRETHEESRDDPASARALVFERMAIEMLERQVGATRGEMLRAEDRFERQVREQAEAQRRLLREFGRMEGTIEAQRRELEGLRAELERSRLEAARSGS